MSENITEEAENTLPEEEAQESEALVMPISEGDFDQILADTDGLILVDFWADWCGPCSCVGPALEELAPEYEDQVSFYKVDIDQNRRLMQAFAVRSVPTVLLMKTREEGGADVVAQAVGSTSLEGYRSMIERALNPPPSLMQRIKGIFGSK